jgi:hypothetical protein
MPFCPDELVAPAAPWDAPHAPALPVVVKLKLTIWLVVRPLTLVTPPEQFGALTVTV